jgi:hypothetical protein
MPARQRDATVSARLAPPGSALQPVPDQVSASPLESAIRGVVNRHIVVFGTTRASWARTRLAREVGSSSHSLQKPEGARRGRRRRSTSPPWDFI